MIQTIPKSYKIIQILCCNKIKQLSRFTPCVPVRSRNMFLGNDLNKCFFWNNTKQKIQNTIKLLSFHFIAYHFFLSDDVQTPNWIFPTNLKQTQSSLYQITRGFGDVKHNFEIWLPNSTPKAKHQNESRKSENFPSSIHVITFPPSRERTALEKKKQ